MSGGRTNTSKSQPIARMFTRNGPRSSATVCDRHAPDVKRSSL
jgi:hypothetical protein